jgi:hypothetical protein
VEQQRAARQIQQAAEQDARQQQRLVALERERTYFKACVAQAQREQQRQAYFQKMQRVIDNLDPKPPPEPQRTEIIYVDAEEDGPVTAHRWFT